MEARESEAECIRLLDAGDNCPALAVSHGGGTDRIEFSLGGAATRAA